MSTAHKIFTNTAGQVVLRGFDVIVGIITLGMITRYLGQEGFGNYTTITAFLQLFIIIIDFGLYLTLLREISSRAEEQIEKITNSIFTLRLVSSAAFLALASVTVFFSPYSTAIKWGVLALAGGFLFSSLIGTLTALFQKYLQMVRVAAAVAIGKVILLGLTVYIISINAGLQTLLYASSISLLSSFLIIWYLLSRLPAPIRLALRFDWNYTKVVIQKTWPIALTTALNLIYFKADTIILSIYQSQESVGLYGASYRVVEIISTFPHMFMGLILPLLTAAWIAHDNQKISMIWEKTFGFFAFLTLPLIAGAFVVGEPLMTLIAGNEFAVSGTILKILILATAAVFFGTLYTYMVLVLERQKYIVKYFAATAVIALIGYFILIPQFSYWGGAWMTVVSEVLIVFGAWLVIRKRITLKIPWGTTLKLVAASVIMALATYALLPYLNVIPLIIVSAALYFTVSIAFKAISIDDIRKLVKP